MGLPRNERVPSLRYLVTASRASVLLRQDSRRLDYLGPLQYFGGEVGAELLDAALCRLDALRQQPLAQIGRLQRFHAFLAEAADDRGRRGRRREHAVPRSRVVARE